MSLSKDGNSVEPTRLILWDSHVDGDSTFAFAQYEEFGLLVIGGQDLGRTVQSVFQSNEYEWRYSVESESITRLSSALGVTENLLEAIQTWAHRTPGRNFKRLFDANGIRYDFWNRIGD